MAQKATSTISSRAQDGFRTDGRGSRREQETNVAVTRPPDGSASDAGLTTIFEVATYNVHRWAGVAGGSRWNPELAAGVISELDVEIIALQEVLRPLDAEDPLEVLADELGLHLTSVSTRVHRHGDLRNAILSRWPMTSAFTIDLSLSRLEQRSAIVTQFEGNGASVSIVSTHLALVDRTRKRQVQSLLDDERLQGAAILLGDMNAWRRCPATRTLEREFTILHHNRAWPPSFPSTRPVLALDRIYARGANVRSLRSHDTPAARKASDHLPVLATVDLDD